MGVKTRNLGNSEGKDIQWQAPLNADGSTTAFTINSGRSVNDVLVVVNGAVFVPTTDYQISGTTLTFQSTAPSAGAEIVFRYI